MAAPVAMDMDTRIPAGIKLDDGYETLIGFASHPTVRFWEKTVKPPGIDGGDAIETTTMFNVNLRTSAARKLKTLTEATFTAAYDPKVYDEILSLTNRETTVTVLFSDGSTLAFFGFLRLFEPQDCAEGAQPEANITIHPTNVDPVNHVEADPVLVEVAGT